MFTQVSLPSPYETEHWCADEQKNCITEGRFPKKKHSPQEDMKCREESV